MSLLARVEALALPRQAGSAGERRAAQHMADAFGAAGLRVTREPFRASRSALPRLRVLVQGTVAAGILLAAAVAPRNPEWACPLAAAIAIGAASAGRWRIAFESAFDTGVQIQSENVIGTRPGAHERAIRLVFLAHLDSKSSRYPTFWPALAALVAIGWCAVVAIVASVAAATGAIFPPWLSALGFAFAAALIVLSFNPSGNESPGAMDNAAGLVVLEELARRLPRDDRLARCELTFVATGAEEIGLAGAMRWIAAHASELEAERTVFANVDSPGVGETLLAIDVQGRMPDQRPVGVALRRAASAAGVRLRILPFLPGVGVDTMPIAARGFATVSILGQVLGAASRRIHSRHDTTKPLREEGLIAAVRLLEAFAREASGEDLPSERRNQVV